MAEPEIPDRKPAVLELDCGTYWWCRCGRSKTQPWCDGSHKGTEFSPVEVVIANKRRYAMCVCKHTGTSPFCDGNHKNV